MACRCKICKEVISNIKYNLEDYVYRIGNKFFCSYKCMLKYERMGTIYREESREIKLKEIKL